MYLSGGLTHQYIICLIKTESFLKYDFTKETNIGFQLFFTKFVKFECAWLFAPFYFHAVKDVKL